MVQLCKEPLGQLRQDPAISSPGAAFDAALVLASTGRLAAATVGLKNITIVFAIDQEIIDGMLARD